MARYERSSSPGEPMGRGTTRLRRHGTLGFGPGELSFEREAERQRERQQRRRFRIEPGAVVAWLLAGGALAVAVALGYRATRVDITQTGLTDGAALDAEQLSELEVQIRLGSAETAESAVLSFDGEEAEVERDGDTLVWRPPEELEEGRYDLELAVPRMMLSPADAGWSFEVDTTPPSIEVPALRDPAPMGEPVSVSGRIEAGADLEAGTGDVAVAGDGSFTVDFARPPAGPVRLAAVDEAGNRSASEVIVPVAYPRTRAVRVTAAAWASGQLRGQVLQLADQGRIDAVHLELKGEDGVVGFGTSVARARAIGAVEPHVDLDRAVEALHDRGVRVVGRLSAFHDPILAGHAWAAGEGEQVIRDPSGQPYGSGGFTNFADPAVQQYNLDIAVDAVSRGVDEILWADIRRPGGDAADLVVASLDEPATEAIAGFLARSHVELRHRGAYQGVVARGLSADRGETVGQDLPRMARHVDYLVPNIHPSFWGPGEFNVSNPGSQPGQFVAAALEVFKGQVEGTGTPLAPSLQAGTRGYGEGEIRAEVGGAASAGVDSFVLESPSSTYPAGALPAG